MTNYDKEVEELLEEFGTNTDGDGSWTEHKNRYKQAMLTLIEKARTDGEEKILGQMERYRKLAEAKEK